MRLKLREEIVNSVTHGIGVFLSITALVLLVYKEANQGDAQTITAAAIYGSTLILMYLTSTLYHSLSFTRAAHIFQTIDHISIYFLIAGTYTYFMLTVLRDVWGWSMLGVIWGLAILGTLFKIFVGTKYEWFSLSLYLIMGWLMVIVSGPMKISMNEVSFSLLWLGGISYTVGTIFFSWEKLQYSHVIWHLFVMLGSLMHFFSAWYS